ncbi:MAG: hypothetical protein U0325_24305 [Polyangiales bacterium]
MIATTWQHAAVAVTALAGDDGATLDAAFAQPEGLAARRAHIAAARDARGRARRILAERLRALTPRSAEGSDAGARLYALWLLGSEPATRRALARFLPPASLAAVRAQGDFAHRHADRAAELAALLRQGVRALRGAPSLESLDALASTLTGRACAAGGEAIRLERSLRVHGLGVRAAALVSALLEAT